MTLVLAMLLGTVAQASGPMRVPRAEPVLSLSGTTATCVARVSGDKTTDAIRVTMKLWSNSICLKTWTKSGTHRVTMNESTSVTRGKTYKLTVDYTVNGVKQLQKSVTKTCS